MDQTNFTIAMVSGVLIIIAIFLFIILKIFGKNKKAKPIETVLPDIDRNEPNEFQPEKSGIGQQEIKGSEKEFQPAQEPQKTGPVIEIMGEQKEDMSSIKLEKTIVSRNESAQIPKEPKEGAPKNIREEILKDIKEETPKNIREEILKSIKEEAQKNIKEETPKNIQEVHLIDWTEPKKEKLLNIPGIQSNEENEKLKLEDTLIEIQDENTQKKVKKKRTPEKKPGKKPGKKVSTKRKKQAIVNEKPD